MVLDRNQIDHLMINGTWRRSLLDVKVKLGADVGSDHHLVTAVLKVKLRKTGSKKKTRRQFDVQKLQDPKTRFLCTTTEEQISSTGRYDGSYRSKTR